jgi:hypothetical protein
MSSVIAFLVRALLQPEVIAEIVVGILLARPQQGASAFNDMAAWVLLSLAVAISGSGGHLPLGAPLWRGMRLRIRLGARREAAHGQPPPPSTVATNMIGIHAVFGAFVFRLTVCLQGRTISSPGASIRPGAALRGVETRMLGCGHHPPQAENIATCHNSQQMSQNR